MKPAYFHNYPQPIRSWVYQLQGAKGTPLSLRPIMRSTADLAVIDYSRNGAERGEFTRSEITDVRKAGKIVLGYMPIGAADAGRFYDQNLTDQSPFSTPQARSLIGEENPDFPGTFYLRYWQKNWQKTIFGDWSLPKWIKNTNNPNNYLKRILAAGFDGVYLDDIDAYQQFNSDGDNSRPVAALEMLLFVRDLSTWAKFKKPGFLVVPQNGENLFNDALDNLDTNGNSRLDQGDQFIGIGKGRPFLDLNRNKKLDRGERSLASLDINRDGSISYPEIKAAYFGSIDGLGSEDFFFKGEAEQDNPYVDRIVSPDSRIDDFKFTANNYLNYAQRNLPILNVEYLSNSNVEGINQYRHIFSDTFQFANLTIITDHNSPSFTGNKLRDLSLISLQSPSRDLSDFGNPISSP